MTTIDLIVIALINAASMLVILSYIKYKLERNKRDIIFTRLITDIIEDSKWNKNE